MFRFLAGLLARSKPHHGHAEQDDRDSFQRSPEFAGASVVRCDLQLQHGVDSLFYWVVYPLANAEQKQPQAQQDRVSLWQSLDGSRRGRDQSGAADHGEGVPPMLQLQPGEHVTHIRIPLPAQLQQDLVRQLLVSQVGDTGFEPVTSAM